MLVFGALSLGGSCGGTFDNPNYVPDVPDPSYPTGSGPVVYFDQAHDNYQGVTQGLATLADLVVADGFQVQELDVPFDQADFTGVSLVVYGLPGTAATQAESAAIWSYVVSGGSLLGITDHPDHPVVMGDLAAEFGVSFWNATVKHDGTNCSPPLCPKANPLAWYAFGAPLLASHPITDGVLYVQSYNGSAIAAWPPDAVSLLTFGPDAIDGATGASVAGASRLVCGTLGAGRFCFASEVQMLTSKCVSRCSQRITGFGGHENGVPNAEYDERLALQLLRWLDGWNGD